MEYIMLILMVVVGLVTILFLCRHVVKGYISNTDEVKPDDIWEKRYYSLVKQVWLCTDEEIESDGHSFNEGHVDTMAEIMICNYASNHCKTNGVDIG